MRKCIRCGTDMKDNLDIKKSLTRHILLTVQPDLQHTVQNGHTDDVKVAVCPQCGYIECYLPNPAKIHQTFLFHFDR